MLGQNGGKPAKYTFVWLDQLVAANLSTLFPGIPVLASYSFRVVRDADIEYHEEEGADLRVSVERGLSRRRFGEAVAMFVERAMPEHLRTLLAGGLQISPGGNLCVEPPLGFNTLSLLTQVDRPDLKYPPFVPQLAPGRAGRRTYHERHRAARHPAAPPLRLVYPGGDLLRRRARPKRAGDQTDALSRRHRLPVVDALLDAANQGKQVAVLVELKARFDEENNIEWARALEQAGVHVAYGSLGSRPTAKVR